MGEVGDGNLNLVFIVKGPMGGVCVKQALPYVRLVGESWPLPIDRAHFEHEALKTQAAAVPMLVPKIYMFDKIRAAIVMELLEPHIILRKGLIRGLRYPKLADDIATFAAETLFSTSDLALPAGKKREQQSMFSLNASQPKLWRQASFTIGLAVIVLVTVGPMDDLADNFVFGHMIQHTILLEEASLLLALGLTGPVLGPILTKPGLRRLRGLTYPVVAVAIWSW